MSGMRRQVGRCLASAAAACALIAIAGSSPSAAAPISPIPNGPQTVELITIPTVVGATFNLNGALITTGADGLAKLPIGAPRDITKMILINPGSGLSSGKAEFIRLSRAPDKDGVLRVYAFFKVSREVSFTFRDSLGNPLPTDRVTSLTVKSSIGESFTLSGDALSKPILLPSERSVSFVNGDSAMKEIYYSVQEVVIAGSNTVYRSQQKFFPVKTSKFEVETVFYTLTIKTSDSLFGYATGSNVVIRWPDKHVTKVPIHSGRAVLPALPRGEYEMRIEGAGLNTWRPISVSRDQTVELELLSYFDGVVVLALLTAVAAACVVVGRRRFHPRSSGDAQWMFIPPQRTDASGNYEDQDTDAEADRERAEFPANRDEVVAQT
ncbi:MAG: hypothetical protein QOE09_1710 [Ilumatobacteraceae bacterium]